MFIKKIHGLGNHLVIDAFSDAELDSAKFIKSFIIELVDKINMTPISKPLVIDYKAKNPMESGVTATIILAESNITIHTYPEKKWFALDIFSCNEFEIDKTMEYLIEKLKITKHKKNLLKRGFY